jgi:hypothetical protein
VFAGTITFAGTGNAAELLLVRLTVSPPAGAFPLITTVTVDVCAETMFTGLKVSIVTTGGFTVRLADINVPLGSVAVMFPDVFAATAVVVTVKVPLLAPPAMLKLPLAGTMAAPFALIRLTTKPPGGAGPVSTTVPVTFVPPVTEPELNVNDRIVAEFTVSVVFALVPSVAVTVTGVVVATPTVVAVNVCDVLVAGTKTPAGTVTAALPLLRETMIPPAGAAWLIVTVPVELVPPVTAAGLKLTFVTVAGGGVTVT